MVLLIQIDQSCVKSAMVCRRESDAISNVICAAICSNRENMGSIHQSQLNAGHGATAAIREQDLLSEAC